MQIFKKKFNNVFWLISLVMLTAATVFVYRYGESKGINYDESKFTLELNSIITTVNLSSPNMNLNFEFINNQWIVNDSFPMDPGMRDAFFTVVSSIRVKRPVGTNRQDSIAQMLIDAGVKVEILNNQELIKEYIVGGDEVRGVSYFINEEEGVPYEVILPGYDSYVAGIYSVPAKDWRNRFVFELDWSTLKHIGVDYTNKEQEGFEINYRDDFFYLGDNPEPLDSALIFDYMGELMNLQAERFLDAGEDPFYDSLALSAPRANVTIRTIGETDQVLTIFPKQTNKRLTLGLLNGELLTLFDNRALNTILIDNSEFR